MSVFWLKIIAAVSMLVDHIGVRAGVAWMRLPGRLAFPIYAFLIGNGLRHTSSRWRYLARLCVLAAVSQLAYTLCLYNTLKPVGLNIFFSLALGLAWLWALDAVPEMKIPVSLGFFALCYVLDRRFGLDYGVRGVILIVTMALFDLTQTRGRLQMAGCFLVLYYLPLWQSLLLTGTPGSQWYLRLPAILALPLLFCYNGEEGPTRLSPVGKKCVRAAFYLFYPVHLLILWLTIAA